MFVVEFLLKGLLMREFLLFVIKSKRINKVRGF